MQNAVNTKVNSKNESHILTLEIPTEGRASRSRRELVWMVDYEEKEGLSDDENAMLVTGNDPVTFKEVVKNKK